MRRQSIVLCSDGPCGGTITAFFLKFGGYCALVAMEYTITLAVAVEGVALMVDDDKMASPLR